MNLNSIIRDWVNSFPELRKSGPKRLLRVCGPVAIGIDLNKIFPTTYRPEAILINLADISYSKPVNIVHQFLRGKKQVQIQIPFEKHSSLFSVAADIMRIQAAITIEKQPSLTNINEWIIEFLNEDYMKGANTFQQYKAILILSQLYRDGKKGEKYRTIAIKGLQKIPKNILNAETNGFDEWLKLVENMETTQIIENVHLNIKRWKMSSLPHNNTLPEMI